MYKYELIMNSEKLRHPEFVLFIGVQVNDSMRVYQISVFHDCVIKLVKIYYIEYYVNFV